MDQFEMLLYFSFSFPQRRTPSRRRRRRSVLSLQYISWQCQWLIVERKKKKESLSLGMSSSKRDTWRL